MDFANEVVEVGGVVVWGRDEGELAVGDANADDGGCEGAGDGIMMMTVFLALMIVGEPDAFVAADVGGDA